jgi:hypothetical protein
MAIPKYAQFFIISPHIVPHKGNTPILFAEFGHKYSPNAIGFFLKMAMTADPRRPKNPFSSPSK